MANETTPRFDLEGQDRAGHRRIARHRPRHRARLRRSGADMIVGVRKAADGRRWTPRSSDSAAGRSPSRWTLPISRRCAPAIAAAHKAFGRIDVLVNNVGIGPENMIENVTEADFDLHVNINLKGTFFTTQAVGRLMIAQKSGRIINISSQAGSVALPGEAIYCMTKAAINHLTRCLAVEWAPHGINVNSVAPTFIWTDGTRPSLEDPNSTRMCSSISRSAASAIRSTWRARWCSWPHPQRR